MLDKTKTPYFFPIIGPRVKEIPTLLKDPRKRWWVILPAILILAAIGGLVYYTGVYLPSQKSTQTALLQTTTARRGDITLSASGTGTLMAAKQVNLGFATSGVLNKLNVNVGDKVKAGDVLAEINNSTQQIALQQAQQALANLTSPSGIATAQQTVAKDMATLVNDKLQLIYLISPAVFEFEQRVAADQLALDQAKAAGGTAPTSDQQKAIDAAAAKLSTDQVLLAGYRIRYTQNYIPDTFTVKAQKGIPKPQNIKAPTAADIAAARAAYVVATATLEQDQTYLSELTGGSVPANATGANLNALETTRSAVQTAQTNLAGTKLISPLDGIVMTSTAQLGDSVGSTALITVADTSVLYLQTYINESDFAMFQVGNSANITFDALPNQVYTGKVVQVAPGLVTSSGSSAVSGLVQLDKPTSNLLIGMNASVAIIGGQTTNAVIIPQTALHQYAPNQYAVFVMRNGKLNVTYVQVGLQDAVNAEIKSGLQQGDVVSTGLSGTKTQ